MKRLMLFTAMAAASFGSANTLAADDTGAWYVAPMGQYVLLDNKRDADDGFGYQLNLGLNFAPNWAAELDGGNGDFDTPSGKGTARHNMLLSQRRAESVMKYLQDHGVTNGRARRGTVRPGRSRPIPRSKEWRRIGVSC
jgi:OmpA family